jgi:hypothetical protein
MPGSTVPDDFPRRTEFGAVAGAQPKLLVTQDAGCFREGPRETEVLARYDMCEDLARQLVAYRARKAVEQPTWTADQLRVKVAAGLRGKSAQWGLAPAEVEWVLRRVDALA